jgi:hypothetical protein
MAGYSLHWRRLYKIDRFRAALLREAGGELCIRLVFNIAQTLDGAQSSLLLLGVFFNAPSLHGHPVGDPD